MMVMPYREPERQQNARPFGSSMAERQRIGCLKTWPCNCKQTPSLRFPIWTFFTTSYAHVTLFKIRSIYNIVNVFSLVFIRDPNCPFQGRRWTFQATRTDENTFGWVILPNMMQIANPLLILAFIPSFDYVIYPILKV